MMTHGVITHRVKESSEKCSVLSHECKKCSYTGWDDDTDAQ